jgi:TetR/AcrR family tetracycline transcriptional repressor
MPNPSSTASRQVGTRAGLTRDAVVAAALTVLRRDGLPGVSMRRVAAELGVAPNALYSHVADKDALLDALVDAVLADVPDPPSGPWRPALETLLSASREVLLLHPDLIPLALGRQAVGPNALRLGNATLALLERAEITGDDAAQALRVLLVHTIGSAAMEAPRRAERDPPARAARARAAGLDERLIQHLDTTTFTTGLHWILDGLTRARSRS